MTNAQVINSASGDDQSLFPYMQELLLDYYEMTMLVLPLIGRLGFNMSLL